MKEQDTTVNTGCEFTDKLIALADEAWYELLKEKMKANLEVTCGEKMEKLAQYVHEGNGERWSAMITSKAKCEQFKSGLAEMMVAGASKE